MDQHFQDAALAPGLFESPRIGETSNMIEYVHHAVIICYIDRLNQKRIQMINHIMRSDFRHVCLSFQSLFEISYYMCHRSTMYLSDIYADISGIFKLACEPVCPKKPPFLNDEIIVITYDFN